MPKGTPNPTTPTVWEASAGVVTAVHPESAAPATPIMAAIAARIASLMKETNLLFAKEQIIWILATIRILQRTLELIAEVLPTCKSKIHSAIRSLDVFLCAILTAQTPCFSFAALDKRTTDAIKAKLCDDITDLVAKVQKLERLRHKDLERLQENSLRNNFIAASLPPPELPPQPPPNAPRRRERDFTDVDFAHMEAVFKIRDIYRLCKGSDSYPAIARRVFKDFKDRLTVNDIVMISHQTLANHAKKKSWPPQRWKAAYNRQKS